ncbi:hypothetical protein L6R49_10440 [Myxococcota bacterium]|nr:hypothetical protein [Myxococcota bacterium]
MAGSAFWGAIESAKRAAALGAARFPDDSPERRWARIARAVVDSDFFHRTYLGHYFRDEGSPFHALLLAALQVDRRVVVRAPRGHSKSTLLSFGYLLHQVVCAPILRALEEGRLDVAFPELVKPLATALAAAKAAAAKAPAQLSALGLPAHWDARVDARMDAWWARTRRVLATAGPALVWDPYIQVIAVDTATAVEFTSAARVELELNALLRSDFGDLTPCYTGDWERRVRRAASDEDWESNGTRVRAFGMDQDIRGGKHGPWRPTLVIADDPDGERTTRTLNQRDANAKKLFGAVTYGLEGAKGRVMVAGTPHHPDCIVVRLTTAAAYAAWTQLQFRALDEAGRVLYASRWPEEALQAERAQDPETFEAEMGDRPPAIGGQAFHTLHYFARKDWGDVALGRLVIFDPSAGQSEKSDYQALVSLRGPLPDGRVLVWRVALLRIGDPLELVDAVERFAEEEAPDLKVVEAIGIGKIVAALLDACNRRAFDGWEWVENQEQGKDLRLRAMAPAVNGGQVLFPDDMSCRPLERQLLEFGQPGVKKDGADALEMGLRRIRSRGQARAEVRHGRRRHGSPFRSQAAARAHDKGGRHGAV